jgi:hypothetical protein
MPKPRCADAEFVTLFESVGAKATADRLEMTERNVYERRRNIEQKIGIPLIAPTESRRHNFKFDPSKHPERIHWDIRNGTVLVASDCHYWPGIVSTAHRAFVHFCKELKPVGVIMNGDVLDGAAVSRHPSGWEERPSIAQEIECANERLDEIVQAAGRKCKLAWPLGNHDARLELRIATVAPELAKMRGVHLKDHFSHRWEPCWSVWINNEVVVKHRLKGGIHATHNNTVASGKTMVTGHLHSLKVTAYTDYNGDRWGVDTGTLADIYGPQFLYIEDSPRNWRSGFAVLTFVDGELLQPELVRVCGDGRVDFRGRIYEV